MPVSDRDTANIFFAEGSFDASATLTELRLTDGRAFRIPTALLSPPDDAPGFEEGSQVVGEGGLVVPLVAETLDISKQTVVTGKVRLEKTVEAHDVTLDEPLAVSTWTVERIAVNQPVDAAPAPRQEGNTTIYPLIEEQLIVTKQLILKEELRVTRNDFERRHTDTVTLRREHLKVDRETRK